MIANFRISEVRQKVEERAEDVLKVIGGQLVGLVTKRIIKNGSVVTSNLVNSIQYSTSKVTSAFGGAVAEGTKPLTEAEPLSVKVGTAVVYAPRVEFGFMDTDSLGRKFNQKPKPYLINTYKESKDKLEKLFSKEMKK